MMGWQLVLVLLVDVVVFVVWLGLAGLKRENGPKA